MSYLEKPNVFMCLGQTHNLPCSSRRAISILDHRGTTLAFHSRRFHNLTHVYHGCVPHHKRKQEHGIRHGRDHRRVHRQGVQCPREHAV